MLSPNEAPKPALRREVRARLALLTEIQRERLSAQACTLLQRQKLWQEARAVLFYAPLSGELDVWPLVVKALEAGKTVALPQFVATTDGYVACQVRDPDGDLASGQFGIREPARHCARMPLNQLDLVLVPGVAFDLHGRRLGRGKGYFDRLLTAVRGTTCGVAFDEQIVSKVPVEPHDQHVNCILTPTRWVQL